MSDPAESPVVPAWKLLVARWMRRAPPFNSRRVRAAYLRRQRARRRAARRTLEASGSDRLSRPALYSIDLALERHLGGQINGYFVEAGANDGFEQSNTYRLERFAGWRGLLVEPVPHLYREAVLERPVSSVICAALVPSDYPDPEVRLRYGGLMTVVFGARGSLEADSQWVESAFALGLEDAHELTAPARTLSSLLDQVQAPQVDLLSLDVEGYEPQALRGLDFDRHAPRFILVEVRDMPEGLKAIEEVLGERYQLLEAVSPVDALYRRRDLT